MGSPKPSLTAWWDEEEILGLIRAGHTQTEIAALKAVSVGTLNNWLHETRERSARARDAMSASAEAWTDRGLAALENAPPDAVEIARARAIEQHCARRAAIRNPKYSERTVTEVTGAGGGAIKTESTLDLSGLTDEQLRVVASIAVKAG